MCFVVEPRALAKGASCCSAGWQANFVWGTPSACADVLRRFSHSVASLRRIADTLPHCLSMKTHCLHHSLNLWVLCILMFVEFD